MGLLVSFLLLGGIVIFGLQLFCLRVLWRKRALFRHEQVIVALSVGATPVLWLLLSSILFSFSGSFRRLDLLNAYSGSLLLLPFLMVASLLVSWSVSSNRFQRWGIALLVLQTSMGICSWFTICVVFLGGIFLTPFPGLAMINYHCFAKRIKADPRFEPQAAPMWFKALWFGSLATTIALKPLADSAITQSIYGGLVGF